MALTRFSELPSDILTEVLTGKHVSYVVIALWKCGDQVLNRKLAKCVTYIDLKDRRLSSTSRYPKLLSQLPNLRYLSLDRGEWPLNGQPWELAAELRLLEGSKLETLRLIEAESVKALHDYSAPDSPSTPPQPIHTQYKNGHSRFLDFQTAFPKLTALKIGPKSFDEFFVWNDFSGLPSNLTWLSTGHCVYRDGVDTHRVMSMLPRSLVTWKLTAKYYGTLSPDASFWADPPPNLTVLGTILCSLRAEHHNFGFLPRTLTTLGVRPASHGSFLEQFSTLPPYVETLNGSISWIPIDISLTKSTTDFRAWGALKHLKKLSLRFSGSSALDFPQFIPSLPETVQSIVLDRTLQSPEWDEMITTFPSFDNRRFWPSSLKTLCCCNITLPKRALELLPPSLTSAQINLAGSNLGNLSPILPSAGLQLFTAPPLPETPTIDCKVCKLEPINCYLRRSHRCLPTSVLSTWM